MAPSTSSSPAPSSRPGSRSAAVGGSAPAAGRTPRPPRPLTAAEVFRLQRVQGAPCVSLLLETRAGERLASADWARLGRLREEAMRRVSAQHPAAAPAIAERLEQACRAARRRPTGRSLAVFVTDELAEVYPLAIGLTERVVVGQTFATRDLVRAMHRTPRHVVLVLSAKEAKLFEAQGSFLQPALGSKFPLTAPPGRSDTAGFLADVDRALGAYQRVHPSPIVLVGVGSTLAKFQATSRHLARLAGKVSGNHLSTPLDQLATLTAPLLEGYLLGRQQEALELLEVRRGQKRAVLGIDGVWLVARWGRPEMLVVEQDFFYPARITGDGEVLEAAEDVEGPDVVDDVVDEVIEIALLRGGWIALVEPGLIPDGARIAVTQHRS